MNYKMKNDEIMVDEDGRRMDQRLYKKKGYHQMPDNIEDSDSDMQHYPRMGQRGHPESEDLSSADSNR